MSEAAANTVMSPSTPDAAVVAGASVAAAAVAVGPSAVAAAVLAGPSAAAAVPIVAVALWSSSSPQAAVTSATTATPARSLRGRLIMPAL